MKGDVCYKAMNSSILWLIFTELYHVNFDVLQRFCPSVSRTFPASRCTQVKTYNCHLIDDFPG